MDLNDITHLNNADDLLEAQTNIWYHLFSFAKSMSLKCAVELGIPDAINNHDSGPMTISQLASALSIHPNKLRSLHRLMSFLVHSSFFTEQKLSSGEKGYVVTTSSRLLLKNKPFNQNQFVLAVLGPVMLKPWDHLSEWFQNDSTPDSFSMAHGRPIWEYTRDDTLFNDMFNEAMVQDSLVATTVVMKKCKNVFEGFKSIVDVGGGHGCMAKAIAQEFPDVECTVLDLPHVVIGLEGNKNLKFISGNMFDEIPPADATLLKHILHGWSDEDSVKILKRCKEANTKKVIVIDMVVEKQMKGENKDKSKFIDAQLCFDMQLVAHVNSAQRTEKEWGKLFLDAGFNSYKISNVLGLKSLMEVYP